MAIFPDEKIVTIFGGSKCTEGSQEYSDAHRVGELLAKTLSGEIAEPDVPITELATPR